MFQLQIRDVPELESQELIVHASFPFRIEGWQQREDGGCVTHSYGTLMADTRAGVSEHVAVFRIPERFLGFVYEYPLSGGQRHVGVFLVEGQEVRMLFVTGVMHAVAAI